MTAIQNNDNPYCFSNFTTSDKSNSILFNFLIIPKNSSRAIAIFHFVVNIKSRVVRCDQHGGLHRILLQPPTVKWSDTFDNEHNKRVEKNWITKNGFLFANMWFFDIIIYHWRGCRSEANIMYRYVFSHRRFYLLSLSLSLGKIHFLRECVPEKSTWRKRNNRSNRQLSAVRLPQHKNLFFLFLLPFRLWDSVRWRYVFPFTISASNIVRLLPPSSSQPISQSG